MHSALGTRHSARVFISLHLDTRQSVRVSWVQTIHYANVVYLHKFGLDMHRRGKEGHRGDNWSYKLDDEEEFLNWKKKTVKRPSFC